MSRQGLALGKKKVNEKNSVPLGMPYGLGISFRLPYAPDFMLYLTAQSIDRIVLHVTHVRSLTGQSGYIMMLRVTHV
jgi:hypothetical protein